MIGIFANCRPATAPGDAFAERFNDLLPDEVNPTQFTSHVDRRHAWLSLSSR